MSARSVVVMVAAGVLLGSSHLYAERNRKAAPPEAGADGEVRDVLRQETASPLDRRASLQPLLKRVPDSAAARWQSGFTKAEKTWRSFDAPLDSERSALLTEYQHLRSEAPQTVRGQLTLAKWCEANGLRDAARAHRTAALILASPAEQPDVLKLLDYQLLDGEWRSPRAAQDWKRSAQDAETSLKTWGPRIERIVHQLQGSARERGTARTALLDIRDPGAIPALEIFLSPHEPAVLIEKLSAMPAYEASLSLARFAIFAEAVPLREAASRALGNRRREDFVPPLIRLLRSPVEGRVVAVASQKGWMYESVLTQETSDRLRVWRISKTYRPIKVTLNIGIQSHFLFGTNVGDLDSGPAFDDGSVPTSIDISRSLGDQLYVADRTTNATNASIDELNGRVSRVLAAISGREPATNASVWWEWWAAYSGVDLPGTKIVDEFSEAEAYRPVFTGILWNPSCFQSGTPVWTESGMQPIERIRVGDRVLAQDVETGELAYKPVLQTSVRRPRQLLRIAAGGEDLTCTDGHRFWVAGEAWTKARDLTAKHLLHTARGTIHVESVTEADVDRTYNLVVADFHSYFVGKQAMLVQDLPLPRSTNCVVPGLQPEW